MKQENYIVVFITAGSAEEAQQISQKLLKQRQAACVNIVPGIDSRYWWQDKLEKAQESLLIVKTRESLLPDIIKSVKKIHRASVPEIIALPIVGGNQDYLDWIDSEVA
ncbi:MAG: cytochrome C biogenesis protein CcdA [Chloroflexi bacterium RBG_16_56_11]|nr:MAG: cytochrome C biogenesis protein CcdA [Chloroflexi bacterium RBG_16_56_11]